MPDDVDDLVRRALGTLEAPAGYLEGDALADRVVARLDEVPAAFADEVGDDAVIGEARDEDSGLQDIRSLASEAKARIRRSSQEAIARGPASSAAWRAVAVADPRRAEAVAVAEAPTSVAIDEVAAARALRVAPPAKPPPVPVRKPRAMFAAAGLAVAMAAGVLIFVTTRTANDAAPSLEVARPETVALAPTPPPPPSAPSPNLGAGSGSAELPVMLDRERVADVVPTKGSKRADPVVATKRTTPGPIGKRKGDVVAKLPAEDAQPSEDVGEPVKPRPGKQAAPPEPSLDDLLKDSSDKPAAPAPKKLARQALSTEDIQRGLAPVGAAARRCYNGTSGTALVRATVAPSGQIAKITISGPFAGTPVAACVERAVRAAHFPAWDGGPQTIATSYLLSD